jgi:polyisoprenoid-binding protein YceI
MGGLNGEINFDKKNTNEFVRLSLKPATLNTGNNKRDDHLRSEDFFYVEKYPLIEFIGSKIQLQEKGNQLYDIAGTLQIRGVSHDETIPIKLVGFRNSDKNKIEFAGSAEINRFKYNIDYTGRMIEDNANVTYKIKAKKIK